MVQRILFLEDHETRYLCILRFLFSLLRLKDPSGRLMRWRLRLSDFEFEIQYRPGRVHQIPDALSWLLTPGASDDRPLDDNIPTFGEHEVLAVTRASRRSPTRTRATQRRANLHRNRRSNIRIITTNSWTTYSMMHLTCSISVSRNSRTNPLTCYPPTFRPRSPSRRSWKHRRQIRSANLCSQSSQNALTRPFSRAPMAYYEDITRAKWAWNKSSYTRSDRVSSSWLITQN